MYIVFVYKGTVVTSNQFPLGPRAIEFARKQHEKGADLVDVKDTESGRIILTLKK